MLVKPLVRPIVRAIAGNPTASLGSGFSPTSLFTDGSKGVVYDNNDLSSFYLDSAGTTAATVNGLVGLQLDKSANLALGAELCAIGAFDSGTGWDAPAGWSIGGGVATAAATNESMIQTGTPSTAGKWYRVEFDFTWTGGTLYARIGAGLPATYATSGRKVCYLLASNTAGVEFYGGVVSGTLDNISVKELTGNHRYQSTTGNKPILRGTPVGGNLVTNGDFASGTGWTAGAGWAIGSGVATATTSSSTLTSTLTATASKNYRVTYTITRSAGSVVMSFGGRSGTSRSAAGTYVDYLDSTTNTNALVFTGTGFSGTVDNIEVVDVTAGSVKAPYALQFDGSDDFLQTASVNFSATDKMLICHGVRTLSNAVTGMIAELSSIFSTTAGSWALYYIPNAQYYWGVGGTPAGTLGGVNTTALPAPTTRVITGVGNISAPEATLRINGLQSATSASSFGTGNFGNHILYFGRRAGNEYPFNGLFYSAICVGKTASAAELANIERWVNLRTGAY